MSLFLYSPSSWPFFSKQPFLCSSLLCCSTLFSSPQSHCSVFSNKICLFCRLTLQICPYKCNLFPYFFPTHLLHHYYFMHLYYFCGKNVSPPGTYLTKHRSLSQRIVINWNTLTNRHFRILMLELNRYAIWSWWVGTFSVVQSCIPPFSQLNLLLRIRGSVNHHGQLASLRPRGNY